MISNDWYRSSYSAPIFRFMKGYSKDMKVCKMEMLPHIDIEVIMNSGQCFSISDVTDKFMESNISGHVYQVLSADKICFVVKDKVQEKSFLYMDLPDVDYWINYFNIHEPYPIYLHIIENTQSSEFLRKCAKESKGLILLNQNLWETIVSFVISQRKSIPSIITSLNRLRSKFGKPRTVKLENTVITYYTFPTAYDLKDLTVDDLSSCGMGYRAQYVINAAKWYVEVERYRLIDLYAADHDTKMEYLKEIHGVGDKVANCICLFALHDIDSFPIDVWIQRVMDKGLIPNDLSEFDGFKGFLQQVIFYYVLQHKEEFK